MGAIKIAPKNPIDYIITTSGYKRLFRAPIGFSLFTIPYGLDFLNRIIAIDLWNLVEYKRLSALIINTSISVCVLILLL